jgi:hypothetical protein
MKPPPLPSATIRHKAGYLNLEFSNTHEACFRCTTLLCLRMSTTAIYENAPDLFRLSIYVPDFDMQFNHFLVRDEEPFLFHAGLKGMFPALREAIAKIIDPAKLRHIAWSHFESDEIGALNDWLQLAPQAQPVCTLVGKLLSVDDFSIRPARGMTPEDVLTTGNYRYRFYRSPHIPHGPGCGGAQRMLVANATPEPAAKPSPTASPSNQ